MTEPAKASEIQLRAVRLWLLAAAAMIFLTLIVGGATRLTESGLSIVEWKPITGVLPPLSENEWRAEFAKYQTIPQYHELNRGMSLDAFKTIYWWEWSHRLLARLTGAVFLLPFLVFLARGTIPNRLQARLWIIFAAGAALGAVGWWMVSSGSDARRERLAVSARFPPHARHRDLWSDRLDSAATCTASGGRSAIARLRFGAVAIAVLLLFQIYLGALVAGLDAGLVYNTWPTIDGAFIPSPERFWFLEPGWRNLFENTLTVQFQHRLVAYVVWFATIWHAYDAWRRQRAFAGAAVLAAVVTMQAGLGIVTLLHQAPISAGACASDIGNHRFHDLGGAGRRVVASRND